MNIDLPADSPMRSPGFLFGVATSSFQIEGAADSRLESIWDRFCDTPGKILDGSNGITACDHVHRHEEDVTLMAGLGVDAYRLSISWPRVIHLDGSINSSGIDFYKRLLDSLNKNGIKPFVTLYHWDLPQYLEDKGGWLNRDTAYRFRDYADKVSRELAGRVYSFATLNEPFCSARLSYEFGVHAPGFKDRGMAKQAAHHLLLAHGLAMPVLQENCRDALNGIVLNLTPCHALSDSEEDLQAAEWADQDFNQWYAQPVLSGGYPALFEQLPAHEQPMVKDGDFEKICQPLDYLGVNFYSRGLFRATADGLYESVTPVGVPLTAMGWEIYPEGLGEVLDMLQQKYDVPPIFITENGIALDKEGAGGKTADPERIQYLASHLETLDRAMKRGADVRGYFAWSLMDNFEWNYGFSKRFGLVHIDYETQERTIKTSGRAFRQMLSSRTGKGHN